MAETTVDLPGGGTITFPDGMSDADINAAMQSHLAQQGGGDQAATPATPTGDFQSAIVRNMPIVGSLPERAAAGRP